jgi:predicted ATP-grasp superfamily ATP-dependent carboligase
VRVTVAGERGRYNLALHSRHAAHSIICPSAHRDPLGFASRIIRELEQQPYDLLIPTTDTSVTILSHQRDRFESLTRVALPPASVLNVALDKYQTIQAATRAGVTVPKTWTCQRLEDVERVACDVTYPCVIKPRFSRYRGQDGLLHSATVRYAQSPAILRSTYREVHERIPLPLIQEYKGGTGVGVFVLADHGRSVAVFAHRRLRESNPMGGAASLAESIAPVDRLVAPATRLFQMLAWHGVAMAEFKDPGGDSEPVLMEINGRFWGSLPLALTAGMDFPSMLVDLFLGGPVVSPSTYTTGVRSRHLKGDLSHLAAVLKGPPCGWTGRYPGRLSTIMAVIPWPGRWHSYNFQISDPLPALLESWHLGVEQVASVVRRWKQPVQSVHAEKP